MLIRYPVRVAQRVIKKGVEGLRVLGIESETGVDGSMTKTGHVHGNVHVYGWVALEW